MREFWIGEGDPGHRLAAGLGWQAEQDPADDDTGMIVGDVRELQAARDIADGIHAPVGRAQVGADRDAGLREFDAGRIEAEVGGIGLAAGCEQHVSAFDHILPACRFHMQLDRRRARLRRAPQASLRGYRSLRRATGPAPRPPFQDRLSRAPSRLRRQSPESRVGDAPAPFPGRSDRRR